MGITLEYIIMTIDATTMTTDFGDTSDLTLTATLSGSKLRLQGVNADTSNNYFIIYIARELSF